MRRPSTTGWLLDQAEQQFKTIGEVDNPYIDVPYSLKITHREKREQIEMKERSRQRR